MKNTLKYLIIAVVIALIGVLFYTKVYIPKTTYATIEPTKGDFRETIHAIGNVSAKNIYTITAQTGGKILALHTDNGEWVKKGDLLVEMDGVDLPAQLAVAKASLTKAEADIKAAQSDLESQKAQKTLIKINFERYAKLKSQNYASQSEYDKAKADLESIDAAIKASQAHINAALAAKRVALKNKDALQIKLDKLKVYAPVNGYVVNKTAEVAQSVLPTTPIFTIVDPKTLWVASKVDERVSSKIKIGQDAAIVLRSNPNKIYKGVVARINATSDPVTFEREIDIAFRDIPKPFYMNEQAQTTISVQNHPSTISLPAKVVVQQHGDYGVWILKQNRAHFVNLQVIAKNKERFAVGNIDEHTRIIIPNPKKKPLKEGMKVHL